MNKSQLLELNTKGITRTWQPIIMRSWLLISDVFALLLAGSLAILIRQLFGRMLYQEYHRLLGLVICGLIPIYFSKRLYPGIGISPPDEIRKLFWSTSAGMALVAILLFLSQRGLRYSRSIFVLFWFFAVFFLPVMRLVARHWGVKENIWQEPVAIIGRGQKILECQAHLEKYPLYGFKPALLINFGKKSTINQTEIGDIPMIDGIEAFKDPSIMQRSGIKTALIVDGDAFKPYKGLLLMEEDFQIRRMIIISELGWVGGACVYPCDLQGMLGLEVQRNLFLRRHRWMKRGFEITLIVLSIPMILPFLTLIAILIYLDSRGGPFYQHSRLGYGGTPFNVLKFRTMVKNGDEVLADYLENNPELRTEWAEKRKLIHDPRVTRVGRVLRQISVDELPQLWNVLLGEMSLVGPRPIVEDEIEKYNSSYTAFTKVKPGMTGMWQVSGRNDVSYDERVSLDEYYVRHWSIWLDIYILLMTFPAVFRKEGAY